MGYSTTHGRSCKLDIPAAWFDAALTDFPVLFTIANLPSEMFDADGSYPAKSDGSDVRFSSDSAGNTPLHVDIATFSINDNPALGTAEIHVGIPSCSDSVATVVYVWYNDPDATLPAADSATEGSQGVWNSDFEAVWHLQESNSDDADHYKDSTANDRHLTGTSMGISAAAAKWASGGLCAEFDGSSDYLSASVAPVSNEPVTFTAWTNSDTRDYINQYVIDVRDSVASERWVLRTFNNKCQFGASHWGGLTTALKTTIPTGGTWAFVGGVTSGNSSRYAMINGAVGSEETTEKTVDTVDRVRVGETFNGKIDEARISSIARSVEWLLAEYNTGNAPGDVTVGTPSSPASGSILPILLQVAA